MENDERNQEAELKDKKDQEPKLKEKNPLRFSLPLALIGLSLAFVGIYIANPQTIVDNIIFYTGISLTTTGSFGCIVGLTVKSDDESDKNQDLDEQDLEPFPEFKSNNDERNLS